MVLGSLSLQQMACMHSDKAWHAGNLTGEADLGKVLNLAVSWKALRWPWWILRSCTVAW